MEKPTIAFNQSQFVNNENVDSTENPLLDNGDNIQLGSLPNSEFNDSLSSAIASSNVNSEQTLGVNDLISDHSNSGSSGGYLQFAVKDGAVMLSIDLSNTGEISNSTKISLATIEGVAGMSNTEILNALLSNHEIKFD